MPITAESWLSVVDDATAGGVVFQFLRTEGNPAPTIREVTDIRRPGIDNLGHYLGGLIGDKFEFKTTVDITSDIDNTAFENAKLLQASYRSFENSLLDLWWQATKVGTVYIYKVQPLPIKLCVGPVTGGLNSGPAITEAVWTMRGIA